MKHSVIAAILAIAAPALFASNPTGGVAPQTSLSPASKPAWVATQGKAKVDVLDVDAHLRNIPSKDRAAFIDSPKRIEQMLSHILLRRNLATEARELGLDKDEVTQRQLEHAIEDVLMARRLQHLHDTTKVPDLEAIARERYLADAEKYKTPDTVSIVHVLLNTKNRTPDEAITQLSSWRNDVVSGKVKLEDVAKKHSEDPGVGSNGGLYADSNPATFVPEFAAAIAALKNPGDVSPPVKTEFGYHLIQLQGRKAARVPAYEEIKGSLVEQARERFLADASRAHVEQLRVLPVEASEESVSPLRERYGQPKMAPKPEAAPATTASETAVSTPKGAD